MTSYAEHERLVRTVDADRLGVSDQWEGRGAMPNTRPPYPEQFREAVALIRSGAVDACRGVGVVVDLAADLRNWA